MKTGLAFLLLLTGAFCGCAAAGKYRERVALLSASDLFLQRMAAILSLENLPTAELFSRLCAMPELSALSFVRKTAERLSDSCDFPAIFRESLREECGALKAEDLAVLDRLSDLVGAYDLDSQLAGIESIRALLGLQLEEARGRAKQDGHLVRSLCVLGGIAAAILAL